QPVIVDRITENPFKDSTRIYPIDYPFASSSSIRLSYILPEGFSVESGPGNSRVSLPDKEMSFTYIGQDQGPYYSVMNQFTLSHTYYSANAHIYLKTIYDEILSRHGQQLVLKRN
ncbi:MAG: hypothetical protein NWR72_04500, partial [Bacteroidia bacterium]|nr:hypothetical protein [Bacteroidia bacterium]